MFALSILSSAAVWSLDAAGGCVERLMATGSEWRDAHRDPFRRIHPGYSPTAESIFYYYDVDGLKIFIWQGPYRGPGLNKNNVEDIFFDYDPERFPRYSYLRQILGNKPLHSGADNSVYGISVLSKTLRDFGDVFEIRIPTHEFAKFDDLTQTVQVFISRSTGEIFGHGLHERKPYKIRWKRYSLEAARRWRGERPENYGFWYNSNSGLPLPAFYQHFQRELERVRDVPPED